MVINMEIFIISKSVLPMHPKRNLMLIVFSLFLFASQAQEYKSLLGFDKFENPEILVITNRLDGEKPNEFLNKVDTTKPLRVFSVTYVDSAFVIVPTTIKSYVQKHNSAFSDYVLFVHGDGKTFLHAAVRGLDIQNTYGVQVIVFAWPSRRDDGQVFNNFATSLKNLQLSENHFAALIDSMSVVKHDYLKSNPDVKMNLFFHSLGNEYLPQYVKDSKKNRHQDFFNNLVINAAAVSSEGHHSWVEKLDIQQHIFINSNAKDVNLNGLRIISAYGYMVGELLVEPLATNAYYVNFSDAIGFKLPPGRSHTYYIGEHVVNSAHVKGYYSDLFHGNVPDFNNTTRFKKRKDGFGYDIVY